MGIEGPGGGNLSWAPFEKKKKRKWREKGLMPCFKKEVKKTAGQEGGKSARKRGRRVNLLDFPN